jgi:hypothetical protein
LNLPEKLPLLPFGSWCSTLKASHVPQQIHFGPVRVMALGVMASMHDGKESEGNVETDSNKGSAAQTESRCSLHTRWPLETFTSFTEKYSKIGSKSHLNR